MDENQRLKQLIKILGLNTQKAFAESIKIQQGSISDILRKKNGMGVSKAIKDKLELIHQVSIHWLETGEGEVFHTKELVVSQAKEGVPYFDFSLVDGSDDLSFQEERAAYLVNYQPFNDCTAYFPVFGDSMYPRYASGEIIAVKKVTNYDILQWGEAYLVLTDEDSNNLRSIKLIFEHPDKSKLILRSSNPNFKGDTIIPIKSIKSLFLIRGKITRNAI